MSTSSSPATAHIFNGCCGCIVHIDSQSRYLPLTQISVHATLLSSTSRTTLTQTFRNSLPDAIKESRYVFPLYDGVSIVAFTCTIGDTVIRAAVKSKPEAKKDFDEAVAQGQHAGLVEQSEEASDVFTAMLGNIGPGQDAKVELTLLGELSHDAETDGLRYTLPTAVAPRYGHGSVLKLPGTQTETSTAGAVMAITVDVDMADSAVITSIQSPSHPITVQIGTTSSRSDDGHKPSRASASLSRSSVHLDKDFIVQICATGLGDPSAILETHATLPHRKALMASLVPRFSLPVEKPEVVFVCDRSGSMDDGAKTPNLVAALRVFLRSLPVGVVFNICSFGSRHSFLWPKSQPYGQKTLDEATAHVGGFAADYGGTEMKEPVEATFKNRDASRNLEVFLMTDGEIWDQDAMFSLIRSSVQESEGAIRVFTLGVGRDVSHALIEGVARAGQGFAQTVGENESMSKKVVRMLKGALTPHIDDYRLEIKYDGDNNKDDQGDKDDDEFEVVEKVSECSIIDSQEVEATLAATKEPISLHNPSVKDEDLEMPDSKPQPLPDVHLPTPPYLQTPYKIPPLFPFNRTSVYVLLSGSRADENRKPKSVILRGTAPQGPLELEIPIREAPQKGTTMHQLAARKAMQELEEGRGWVYDAKLGEGGKKLRESGYAQQMDEIAKAAGVQLGLEYQVAGKWCSFVGVSKKNGVPVKGEGGKDQTQMQTMAVPPPAAAPMRALCAPMAYGGPMSAGPRLMRCPVATFKSCRSAAGPVEQSEYDSLPIGAPVPQQMQQMQQQQQKQQLPPRASDAVIALQSFEGSWSWTAELEGLVGVTEQEARSRLAKTKVAAAAASWGEILATLCAVAYLRVKQAEDSDVWELVVGKAREWLAGQLGVVDDGDGGGGGGGELGRLEDEVAGMMG